VALHPTDLDVRRGATTALIGPSGSGKSTLLRLMIGLLEPTSGAVLIDGEAVRPDNVLQRRRRMGYVIQDGGLFPHLTAEQNILLMARHLGRPEAESRQRLEEIRRLTNLPPDCLSRYPIELSGGQRQRVGLMRALMLDPDILLLDEPLGALDPVVRAGLQSDLKVIFQRMRKTVVIVTHDMPEASYLADRIVLLSEGHVVQEGTPEDLCDRPVNEFVSAFMNAQGCLVNS
jgi:osmoprotectant transport system ATP-binding protein